jgi:hypothetical protein
MSDSEVRELTYVAVGKVFCDNPTAWLFLLTNFIGITLRSGSVVVSLFCAYSSSAAHFDLCRAKLGVVE